LPMFDVTASCFEIRWKRRIEKRQIEDTSSSSGEKDQFSAIAHNASLPLSAASILNIEPWFINQMRASQRPAVPLSVPTGLRHSVAGASAGKSACHDR